MITCWFSWSKSLSCYISFKSYIPIFLWLSDPLDFVFVWLCFCPLLIFFFHGPPNSFRDTFPSQYYRWKNLEVHCNNDQSIRHSSLSKSESSKMPELSFNRLQLTDQECAGLQRRNFGRFVAREALLDEEYWVSFVLTFLTL